MPNRKKKLDFTPFSQTDVNTMLADVPLVDERVKAVKVISWFMRNKPNEDLFGIDIQLHSGGWLHMIYGQRAVVFSEKKQAQAVCRVAKQQLSKAVA